MGNKGTYIKDIFILAAFALIPLLWFRNGYGALAGFDFSVYLNPVATLERSFYLWSDNMAGGYDSSHEVSSMAYYLLLSLPVIFGASLYTAEKLVFASLFALQGFAMYYMTDAFFGKADCARSSRLLAAFLYAFSFPVMAHFGRGNLMALLAYALLPLILGLLKKGFERPERRWRYILMLSLLSFPLAAVKGHPADFLVIALVSLFFILFHAASSDLKSALRIISFAALAFVSYVFVSLWWLVPNVQYLADFGLSTGDLVTEGFYNTEILSYYSSGTSMLKAFRNESLDLWFDQPGGIVFNSEIYQSPLFIFIGLAIPAIAFMSALRTRPERGAVFLALTGLVAVFMFKGNHGPYGGAFEWLYMNVPGFFLFRAPYRIFSSLLLFAIAPLCALVLASAIKAYKADEDGQSGQGSARPAPANSHVYDRWHVGQDRAKRFALRITVAFFVLMAGLYAWPVFTGAHMREGGTLREPGVFQNIPNEYFEAAAWINGNKGDSKVYLPYEIYDANMTWGYNGPDPLFELIEAPKAVSRPGGTVYVRYQRPVEALNRLVREWEYGDLRAVLGVHGAKYIAMHDDLNRWVLSEYNFNEYAQSLFEEAGVELKKDFGPVSVYENTEAVKRVYVPEKPYLYSGDESGFPDLSLAGFLTKPFLVKTEDVRTIDEAKDLIQKTAGLLLHRDTLTDAVVGMMSTSNQAIYSNGKLMYDGRTSGLHHVYAKGQGGANHLIFGEKGMARAYPSVDGEKWKRLATIDAQKGKQEIDALWQFSSQKTASVHFAVVPAADFDELNGLLSRRIKEDGFDLISISNDASAQMAMRSFHDLAVDQDEYVVFSQIPVRYERIVKNAFDSAVSWESMVDGRPGAGFDGKRFITSTGPSSLYARVRLPDIDVGQYPVLVFNTDIARIEEGHSSLSVEMYFVDANGAKEELYLSGEKIRKRGGSIDLREELKKNASTATFHRLREVRFYLSLLTKNEPALSLAIPRLEGRFGVMQSCGRSEGIVRRPEVTSVGDKGASQCAKWVETGIRDISVETSGEQGRVYLLQKKVVKNEQEEASLSFIKENPTRYTVSLDGKGRTQIVFSESFDRDWVLRSKVDEIWPVRVNGFANGFFVDLNGPTEFTLEYSPQRYYRLAGFASAVSLTAIAVLAVKEGFMARAASKDEGGHES